MTKEQIQEILQIKRKLTLYLQLMGATIDGDKLIVFDGTVEALSRMLELLTKNQ